ncbi:MAG: hypothetical protein RLZZ584_4030 [Pseudomonadota bacterium]|jgi:hypothetical protein
MAITPNPSYALTAPSSHARLAIDNLLRRELKIGDPNDPGQVAGALLERYRADARTQALDGEARGLPFLNSPAAATVLAAAPTATDLDLDQARSDVQQDLAKLLTSNFTKDVRPELEGWQRAIGVLIDQGVASARMAMDPYSRDRTLAMRRELGEYAFVMRVVGALTPALHDDYRNLAQSLDEVASVLLVLMGEAIANAGMAGGRYLLQVPYSELQTRRDAVLINLRQLRGGIHETARGEHWALGLDGYQQLHEFIERNGQLELRSLLNEAELSRTLDEMVQLASGGSAHGMRMLGATAWSSVNRLHRFIQVTLDADIQPRSPAVTAFLQALQLFVRGFGNAGGHRLLRIARPAILTYGMYGSTSQTEAERRLVKLVNLRGELASQLDCLGHCNCDDDTLKLQVVLDKILFDLDRSIDLYCIGTEDWGAPEQQAAACAFLIAAVLDVDRWFENVDSPGRFNFLGDLTDGIKALFNKLALILLGGDEDNGNLSEMIPLVVQGGSTLIGPELIRQLQWIARLGGVIRQMTTGCMDVGDLFNDDLRASEISENRIGNLDKSGVLSGIIRGAVWILKARTMSLGNQIVQVLRENVAVSPYSPAQAWANISDDIRSVVDKERNDAARMITVREGVAADVETNRAPKKRRVEVPVPPTSESSGS